MADLVLNWKSRKSFYEIGSANKAPVKLVFALPMNCISRHSVYPLRITNGKKMLDCVFNTAFNYPSVDSFRWSSSVPNKYRIGAAEGFPHWSKETTCKTKRNHNRCVYGQALDCHCSFMHIYGHIWQNSKKIVLIGNVPPICKGLQT